VSRQTRNYDRNRRKRARWTWTQEWPERSNPAIRAHFEINLLGDRQRVVHLDTEVQHRALELAVAEQQLSCS
jgi:hypothetical protein